LRAVGTLTSAAAAAEVSDQPSSTTRLARRQAEGGVTVELHPDVLLDLGGFSTPSLQGGPDETTGSGITSRLGREQGGAASSPRAVFAVVATNQ
jgi:hypothetical protein